MHLHLNPHTVHLHHLMPPLHMIQILITAMEALGLEAAARYLAVEPRACRMLARVTVEVSFAAESLAAVGTGDGRRWLS